MDNNNIKLMYSRHCRYYNIVPMIITTISTQTSISARDNAFIIIILWLNIIIFSHSPISPSPNRLIWNWTFTTKLINCFYLIISRFTILISWYDKIKYKCIPQPFFFFYILFIINKGLYRLIITSFVLTDLADYQII